MKDTLTLSVLLAVLALSVRATPTLVSRWDFDTNDAESITDVLKPTVGMTDIEVRTGSGASAAVASGTLGEATIVAGATTGDFALALPAGTHLKVPFPTGVIQDASWSIRVRFLYPSASAGKIRAILQPSLENNAQYLFGLNADNRLWVDDTQSPGKGYSNYTNDAENQFCDGNNTSRTAAADQWHTFTLCCGSNGYVSFLNGVRTSAAIATLDPRTMFTGDGLLLFADDSGEDALVHVSSVELWRDTPVYHATPNYLPTSSATLVSIASLDDLRDGLMTIRGLGTWIPYSTPMQSFERIVTNDADGHATAIKTGFVNWNNDQNILMQFTQNGTGVAGNSLRMAWGLGFSARYFTDTGAYVSGQNSRTAGTSYNYGGYTPYALYSTPFVSLLGSINWTKFMGVGTFGSPRITACVASSTLTFDQAPKAAALTFESGYAQRASTITLAFASGVTLGGVGDLNIDKDVTLALPMGYAITGALTLQKGAAMSVAVSSLAETTTLFTAANGVVLPEGVSLSDCVSVTSDIEGTVKLSDDKTQILFAPPDTIPITAVWTGAGDREDPSDPANWVCRNAAGETLDGAIPTTETTITVTGETSFNVPAGKMPTCYALNITGSVSLTADCDWRGLASLAQIAADACIDLQGHELTAACQDGESAVAFTVTDSSSGTAGHLHFSVPEGATFVNSQIALTGNLRFVKEGAGTYQDNKVTGKSYAGGTEIASGTYSCQSSAYPNNGQDVVVDEGAIFVVDAASTYGMASNPVYVLNGGTMKSAGNYSSGWAGLTKLKLTADSTLESLANFGLIGGGYGETSLDLAGHTLTIPIGSGNPGWHCWFYNVTATKGTVKVTTGGWLDFDKTGIRAPETDFDLNCALKVMVPVTVHDLTARWGGPGDVEGDGEIGIGGTYTPVSGYIHHFKMLDGSTIDLRARTGSFSLVNSANADYAVAFATGASVTVDVAGRRDLLALAKSASPYLLTWQSEPDAAFTLNAGTRTGYSVAKDATGLKLVADATVLTGARIGDVPYETVADALAVAETSYASVTILSGLTYATPADGTLTLTAAFVDTSYTPPTGTTYLFQRSSDDGATWTDVGEAQTDHPSVAVSMPTAGASVRYRVRITLPESSGEND